MTPTLFGVYEGPLYARMARVLEASARRHCPDWDLQIVSQALDRHDGGSKLGYWLRAVEALPEGAPILLTDVDAMVTGPLDAVWDLPFELAYTAREAARTRWPYNSGVIFLRASAATRQFLDEWRLETRRLCRYPSNHPIRQQLRAQFGAAEQGAFHAVLMSATGTALRTAALPCRIWNCEDSEWARFSDETRLVHTKGAFRDAIAGKTIKPQRKKDLARLLPMWREIDRQVTGRAASSAPLYSEAWQEGRRWTWGPSTRCLEAAFAAMGGAPASLLDIGCGLGHLVRRAAAQGVDAMGIDLSVTETDGPIRHADLTQPVDLGRRFDVVLCWEVAEHLPAESADVLCDTITRHLAPGGSLLFTAAVPGQGGKGHINEQPSAYWREKFAARGWYWHPRPSAALARTWRRVAAETPWYGDNLQVFRDVEPASAAPTVEEGPRLALTIRTADRAPKRNYLGGTLRRLAAQGVDLTTVQVAFTSPDTRWASELLATYPVAPTVPARRLNPNANGLAQVRAGLALDPEWVVLMEDDLEFCADFVGSLQRWLRDHDRADRHVFRCFGFTTPPAGKPAAYDWPLEKLRGSQVIILRAADAKDFLDWGTSHLSTWVTETPWRGRGADPGIAFDKFVAAWATTRWPGVPGVISYPYFVKHIGDQSSIHARGVRNDAPFAGEAWRYPDQEGATW